MDKPRFSRRDILGYARTGLLLAAISPMVSCQGFLTGDESARRVQKPFTIVVLPDTQRYSEKHPALFLAQTDWIRDNADKENIVFVSHVGDIVEHGGKQQSEWSVADQAMTMLDGVVPWGVAIGNHDYDDENDPAGKADTFVKYFGPKRFDGCPWYCGASSNGLNSYQLFSAGGIRFIVLHLECDVPDDAITWARCVLNQHPDRPAIVSTHIYLDGRNRMGHDAKRGFRKGGNSGEQIWQNMVKPHPQVFMVLCGHQGRAGEFHQVSMNSRGGKVLELLADYQKRPNGGNGWLRLIRFVPARGEIQVRTYSPTLDRYETDADSQFTFPLELPGPRQSSRQSRSTGTFAPLMQP